MIHVLFCSSAAGTLRQVLTAKGKWARVVGLAENLSWGPIGSNDFKQREAWLDHNIPAAFGAWDWIAESVAEFHRLISANPQRLVWIAPASSQERAGLSWFLQQFGGTGLEMALADFALEAAWGDDAPQRLGTLDQGAMGELYDRAIRVSHDAVRFPMTEWRKLAAENTPLRILDNDKLVSASEDHFDMIVKICCRNEWTDIYRVIGNAMVHIWDLGSDIDDAFLLWRVRQLVSQGDIICEGPLPRWGASPRDRVRVRRADNS